MASQLDGNWQLGQASHNQISFKVERSANTLMVSLEGHASSVENQLITSFLYSYTQYQLATSNKYCLT